MRLPIPTEPDPEKPTKPDPYLSALRRRARRMRGERERAEEAGTVEPESAEDRHTAWIEEMGDSRDE
jgi:hypothetical protein